MLLLLGHEVFNTAVGPFGDLKIHAELKSGIFTLRNDIASVRRLATVGFLHDQFAIFHHPSVIRESVFVRSTPAFRCLTIKKERPTLGFLLVGQLIDRRCNYGHRYYLSCLFRALRVFPPQAQRIIALMAVQITSVFMSYLF